MSIITEISSALQEGNVDIVKSGIKKALSEGVSSKDILEKGLLAGMSVIGEKFRMNEIYIPEVLVVARAMHVGMEVLRPKLVGTDLDPSGKIVLGTVKGDIHDIGKNLVKIMFEGAGIQIIDLGIDVTSEQFIEAVKKEQPDILGLSALLTTTMPEMGNVIQALTEAGLHSSLQVMVGGAPVTEAYAEKIGADHYAKDAGTAAAIAKKIIEDKENRRKY